VVTTSKGQPPKRPQENDIFDEIVIPQEYEYFFSKFFSKQIFSKKGHR
jgi:hypothetical protein